VTHRHSSKDIIDSASQIEQGGVTVGPRRTANPRGEDNEITLVAPIPSHPPNHMTCRYYHQPAGVSHFAPSISPRSNEKSSLVWPQCHDGYNRTDEVETWRVLDAEHLRLRCIWSVCQSRPRDQRDLC
jgi:hypothetical protein